MFRIFRKPPSRPPREPPPVAQTAGKPQHKRKPTASRDFVRISKNKMPQFAPLQAAELQACELQAGELGGIKCQD